MAEKNILVTGAAGFIGQTIISPLLASDPALHLTLTDVVEPPVPAHTSNRVTSVAKDLTDPVAIEELLGAHRFDAVYILHGLMSFGSESNLDLGLGVNVDSIRGLLDFLRKHQPGTTVVFASSTAVYGPNEGEVTEMGTVPLPQGSYGAEKLIVELLLNDYSRRGLLDGRIVRLPTVVVRPGKPSAAASSFASGIVRESLQGIPNILPVSRDLGIWICSPATVVKNLVKVKGIPAERFGTSRIVNLPGITVSVQDILDAVEKVGGKEALACVREEIDPDIDRLVGSWSAKFDVSRAYSLGLEPDGELIEAVRAFADSLQK
ncbi:hypothetical protein BGZ63DRAFT_379055 [Mariannaea sp. PMI_226]|nr:hypothetical protein BGZ63DRAFT_379055 [Mariannaea sp. PMI_226]